MLISPVTLSRQHLAAYALLAVPLAFLGLPLYVYLPAQYAAMPEIGLALSGLVLMGARLLDLFATDLRPTPGRTGFRRRADRWQLAAEDLDAFGNPWRVLD